MNEALELARQGMGRTSPNPTVGAVLVKDGEVIGRGFHTYAQAKHAEMLALEEAGEQARGATLYITLEPCSHHGRTPPCADALVKAGVARVVAAMEDPNPPVAGQGFRRLHDAGVTVEVASEYGERGRAIERSVHPFHAHRPPAGDAESRADAGRQDRRARGQYRLDHQRARPRARAADPA